MKKELEINENGSYISLASQYFLDDTHINVNKKSLLNHQIKITTEQITLNDHGGYISPKTVERIKDKKGIIIAPSAIVGDVEIGDYAVIGANTLLADGVKPRKPGRPRC